MLSLSNELDINGDFKPIAIVKNGIKSGTVVNLFDTNEVVDPDEQEVKIKGNSIFQPLPDPKSIFVYYIAGPQGIGKSTYVGNLVKWYHKIFPHKKVIVFSANHSDKPLDDAGVKWFDIDDPRLIEEPPEVDQFRNDKYGSLLIFDDIFKLANKKIQKAVFNLMESAIDHGRVHTSEKLKPREARNLDVDVIITNHQLCDFRNTRNVLNEATHLVYFPKGGSLGTVRYLLEKKLGLDKQEIKRVMALNSRFVCISKYHPQYVITEKEIFLLTGDKN